MRMAVVHEWLSTYAGSERVLEQILRQYPVSTLFSTVDFLETGDRGFLGGRVPRTTFIQQLPLARRGFRNYLPLMPMAVEQHDLSSFDLVLSSHHSCAKGVITRPDQLHVCYVHSPARYAWDLQDQYLTDKGIIQRLKSSLARALMHYFRMWDRLSADRVDTFLANSRFISSRIRKYYRRPAIVVHPPVETTKFSLCDEKDDYYLTSGRLVPYKRADLVVEAFSKHLKNKRLIVVGDGPEMTRIKQLAGPNVEILGHQTEGKLIGLLQRAKAFVFAGVEDFGIATVEAQACGTPVIALGQGGTLDIVIPDRTGVLFHRQTVEDLVGAIAAFERHEFIPEAISESARRFSPERFRQRLAMVLERAMTKFKMKQTTVRCERSRVRNGAIVP